MRLFNFVSIKLTLCLVIGIVLGFYLNIPHKLLLLILPIVLAALYFAAKKQGRRSFPLFELLTGVVTIVVGIYVTRLSIQDTLDIASGEENGIWELKVREVLKPNSFSQRYIAKVQSHNRKPQNATIILNFPLDSTTGKLHVDDEVMLVARATEIGSPRNPHSFDYKDFLAKQGIHRQIRVNPEHIIIKANPSSTLYGMASQFRANIISKLKKESFGKEELGVIQALLLGQRDDISERTYNNYKNAGAVHILAVSGLHVGVLLLLLQFFLSPLERLSNGKGIKLFAIVLLLWTYAFIAGLSPSIVRAVTMFSFLAYAMHLNRPTNGFNILALSMLFILLVKPLFLFQVGFQMSYAAVFAIVWIYPKLQHLWFPDNLIVRKVWQLLSVSIAAQLGVLPISLFYFHQFPALFFVSNLLVVPFLGILLGMGILVIVLSITDALPHFLVTTYNFLIHAMNSVVAWVGQQERFIISDIPFDGFQLVLCYLLIISIVIFFSGTSFRKFAMVAFAIIGLQVYGILDLVRLGQKEILIVGHHSRATTFMHQMGGNLTVYSSEKETAKRWVRDFAIGEKADSITSRALQNSYIFNGQKLHVMDSIGQYPKQLDYLIIIQSPKIHLDRLLSKTQPKLVIADGSNYPSYVNHWKATCIKKEIPFHHTGEKGHFMFGLSINQ